MGSDCVCVVASLLSIVLSITACVRR